MICVFQTLSRKRCHRLGHAKERGQSFPRIVLSKCLLSILVRIISFQTEVTTKDKKPQNLEHTSREHLYYLNVGYNTIASTEATIHFNGTKVYISICFVE